MEEKVVIRHAVPGDEAMLAEIQAESWEAAFTGILPDEKLKATSTNSVLLKCIIMC